MKYFLFATYLLFGCNPVYAQYGDGGYSESGSSIAGDQANYAAAQAQAQ